MPGLLAERELLLVPELLAFSMHLTSVSSTQLGLVLASVFLMHALSPVGS